MSEDLLITKLEISPSGAECLLVLSAPGWIKTSQFSSLIRLMDGLRLDQISGNSKTGWILSRSEELSKKICEPNQD